MPKALEGEKTPRVTLSLRVTPDIKARIEADARKSGRSLAVEAEARLEQSFDASADFYGPHNVKLGEIVAMVAASVGKQAEADWRSDEVAATYVFARIKRTLAAFMGAVEDPGSLPQSTGNKLLDPIGSKTNDERRALEAAISAGQDDEDELLKSLSRKSLEAWRRGE